MNRQEIEAQLIEKANADPAFRQWLLDDPKSAIADFLGAALPPGMNITVLEEEPGRHYLVLPPAPPAIDALPLDELDLALVGGGRTLRPIGQNCRMSNTVLSSNVRTKNSTSSSC